MKHDDIPNVLGALAKPEPGFFYWMLCGISAFWLSMFNSRQCIEVGCWRQQWPHYSLSMRPRCKNHLRVQSPAAK